jgi:hypothetical protein
MDTEQFCREPSQSGTEDESCHGGAASPDVSRLHQWGPQLIQFAHLLSDLVPEVHHDGWR